MAREDTGEGDRGVGALGVPTLGVAAFGVAALEAGFEAPFDCLVCRDGVCASSLGLETALDACAALLAARADMVAMDGGLRNVYTQNEMSTMLDVCER
jgi:hypothetical protein